MDGLAASQYGVAPALASALLHSLWQDSLLALAAAFALAATARASAAWRHTLAMAFLLAMVLVPVAQFLSFWRQPVDQINAGWLPVVTAMRTAHGVIVQQSSPLAMVVALLWLLGVCLMLLRHAGGLRAIAAMEGAPYRLLPPEWQQRADELRAAMGIAHSVAVRLTHEVVTPCAARLVHPVVWLPLSLLTNTPREQLEALLAHELAHVARRDWLWNGLQCVIESLLFFHPAAWWLSRRIRREREHACDDLAVAACGDAIVLAEALTALALNRQSAPRLVLAAHGGSLMQRIARLLAGPPSRGRWAALAGLGALTVSGVLLVTLLALAGNRLPDLNVRSSTEGPLGPGDYREITANGLDKLRYYRASLDAQGRLSEIYREDGRDRPIDSGARRWVDSVSRMTIEPAPPPRPQRDISPEFDALMRLVAVHPDIVARLGAPVVVAVMPPNGTLSLNDTGGDADLRLELRGPRGHATVRVEADLRNRIWTLRRVSVH